MRVAVRALLRDRKAVAATEFAFILPVMLTFMAGITEFGRMFLAYDAVNRLATRYASVYADCNDSPAGTCKTELGLYWPAAAVKNIAPQLTNTGSIGIRIFEVNLPLLGTPTVVYSYPSGLNWSNLSSTEQQRATTALYTGTSQETGVVVTVQYTHQLLFFSALMQQYAPSINSHLNITYTVAQRKT